MTTFNFCPDALDRLLRRRSAWFVPDRPSRVSVVGDTSCVAIQSHVIPIRRIWPVLRSRWERRNGAERRTHCCRAPADLTRTHAALEAQTQGARDRLRRRCLVAAQHGPHGRTTRSVVSVVSSTRPD